MQTYLKGDIGLTSLSKQHGLSKGQVTRWVSFYKIHGEAGLVKKFTGYEADQKLAILQHMWTNQLSYDQTAAVFNIRSPGSISVWERCYHTGGIDALMPRPRGRSKKMPHPLHKPQPQTDDETRTREELLAEVNFLRMENAYLKKLKALVQQQRERQTTTPKKRK